MTTSGDTTIRASRGFTLVELVVAIGITAVLAAVLLSVVTQTLNVWDRTSSALSLENDAERILRQLAADTAGVVVRADDGGTAEWLRIERGDSSVSALAWFVNCPGWGEGTESISAVREVRYTLLTENGVGRLYRWQGDAASVLSTGYAFTEPGAAATSAEFLLGESITEWEVEASDGQGDVIDDPGLENWPTLLRWQVRLISPDGARRLVAVSAGESNEPVDQITEQTTAVFSRSVAVGGRPR